MPGTERSVRARRWLEVADRDLAVIRLCLGAEPMQAEVAAYHCQQAVEKVAKAFLVAAGVRFRKTHSIDELAGQVTPIDQSAGDELNSACLGHSMGIRASLPAGGGAGAPADARRAGGRAGRDGGAARHAAGAAGRGLNGGALEADRGSGAAGRFFKVFENFVFYPPVQQARLSMIDRRTPTHIDGYTGYLLYGESTVKTTVDLPDELFRRAKVAAAARGRRLKDLVEEGLELVLAAPRGPRPDLARLMQDACGVMDSGVPDLGSKPAHLAGFGRDPARDR